MNFIKTWFCYQINGFHSFKQMWRSVYLIFLLVVATTPTANVADQEKMSSNVEDMFEKFVQDSKQYMNEADKLLHNRVFKESMQTISKFNADIKRPDITHDTNRYAEFDPQRMLQMFSEN